MFFRLYLTLEPLQGFKCTLKQIFLARNTMKNTTFLIHIQEMDCPVEKAEIEKYFAKNPDFEPVATDLMHRTMRFVAKSEKATSKLLLENLKKAGFPGEVVNEADGTTSPIPVRIPDLDSEEKVEKLKKAFENDTAFEILTVNLADKSATFTKRFPEALTEDLFTKLASLNLPASEILSTEKKAAASESHWGAFRLGVALVLAGCGEAFEIAGTLNETPILAVCLAAIALSGIKTLIKGICNLPCFVFNMNTLMAVAVLGAVAIGQYPEAAMVMVLYEIGEAIEDKTLAHARSSIQTLLEKAPSTVEILLAGKWIKSSPEAICPGTIYRAVPGQMIAADGVVVDGVSSVDVSSITGEPLPESAREGSVVRSGSIALDGTLSIRATRAATDSTAARISKAILSAQQKKARVERFIDSFARWYTPTIFVASLLLGIGTVLWTGTLDKETIYRSLVLLVIGCPCALVISTPVALLSAMTCASRQGVFIRGGVPMETAATIQTAVFDKTGTLTVGRPTFKDLIPVAGCDKSVCWHLAASLAAANKHPLSQALARACDKTVRLSAVKDLKNLPGYGVQGRVDGALITLTNRTWLKDKGLLTPEVDEAFSRLENDGNTCMAVSNIFGALGVFAFADTAKPGIAASVKALKNQGVAVWILTGDNEKSAAKIAREAGIDNVRARLLPQEKLAIISELDGKSPTAMIGDGINDAPSLARARLGIAMGGAGSDTAIESADVVLMNDDVAKVGWLKRLSIATRRCVTENIVFALGVKALFAVAAVTGYATMWMAVFADTGVCLIVVALALRLLRFK